jgi:ATP-binding cassette subfamily F protein uup
MNLLNVEDVTKDYGKGRVLDSVRLGVAKGEKIGVVGRNGGGKSTLLRIMSGEELPDSGRVTREGNTVLGYLSQADTNFAESIERFLFAEKPQHIWAGDSRIREILVGLLGGWTQLDRAIRGLSGGERRRVALAKILIDNPDLLMLDEPTNHLDVEGISWLAEYLKRSQVALVVVTHDRWFLDEISDRTWEVVDGKVEVYEGGYSAYVLAKAERLRQAVASESRRQNLIRKELAWLRRGAPARTSKPKFRIDAANELISNEPPPRKKDELLTFAGNRLGKRVFELHDIELRLSPDRALIERLTLNIGPGERIGIVGPNGAGKTTFLKMLNGDLRVTAGKVAVGSTVKIGYLSQQLDELDPEWRVLEAVTRIAERVDLGDGREISASLLCERLGFSSDAQWTPVRDLSGGERRRLQLTRILMHGPNVLFLDEPTNDFDVETLSALEDVLDEFAGTLIVVSHDRYFLERVCDKTLAIFGDGKCHDLPGGIDSYLQIRSREVQSKPNENVTAKTSGAQTHAIKKERERIERQLQKIELEISTTHQKMIENAVDFEKLNELSAELRNLEKRKDELENRWLELSD